MTEKYLFSYSFLGIFRNSIVFLLSIVFLNLQVRKGRQVRFKIAKGFLGVILASWNLGGGIVAPVTSKHFAVGLPKIQETLNSNLRVRMF